MPKTTSNDLFDLIRSLSQAEKKYFRVFASRKSLHKKADYIRLFGLIEKQKSYNEMLLTRKIKAKHFSMVKNYLYELILKSLDSYHSDDNEKINLRLKKMLISVQLLYEKGLYDQCDKIVEKAGKIAEKYELFTSSMEIIEWKDELAAFRERTQEYIEKESGFEKALIKRYENFRAIRNSSVSSFVTYNKYSLQRDDNDLAKLKDFIKVPLEKREKLALSYNAKFVLIHLYAFYYFLKGDMERSSFYLRRSIELMEKYPEQVTLKPLKYAQLLHNLSLILTSQKKYTEAMEVTAKIRVTTSGQEHVSIQIFALYYKLKLLLYILTGLFQEAIYIIPEIKDGLKKWKGKIKSYDELIFQYLFAYTFFGADHYKKALELTNPLINTAETDLGDEVRCFARLLRLLINFELGNLNLLEYEIRSTYRYLHKKGKLYKFESAILKFVRQFPNVLPHKELMKAFEELKNEFLKLSEDPMEKQCFEYLDLISWLESKIMNKTFAEIIIAKS